MTNVQTSAVRGLVTGGDERIHGLVAKVFGRGMRSEQLLGEARVGERGEYEIRYSPRRSARHQLVVRVYGPHNEMLGVSDTLVDVPPEATVNVVLDSPDGGLSEYERVLSAVTPLLDGVPLGQLTDVDVRFLYEGTGIDATHLRMLADAISFGAELRLPAEAGYGWARQDFRLVRRELLAHSVGELREALVVAIRGRIVPETLERQLGNVEARLRELGAALDEPEPGVETTPIVGQLLTERDGRPLARFTVRGADPSAKVQPGDLGSDVTDDRGYFGLAALPWPDDSVQSVQIRLEVDDQAGNRVLQTELRVERRNPTVHQIRVPVEAPDGRPPSPEIGELHGRFGFQVPAPMMAGLRERGVRTVTDLRRAGGLRNADGLDVDIADPAARKLEAHANLAAISLDPERNAKLVERGFTSVRQIAKTSRAEFVATAADIHGDVWAARMHVAAQTQYKLVDSALAGELSAMTTTGSHNAPSWLVEEFTGTGCHCDDCQAATSPLAYLADLLTYAIDHLKHAGSGQTTLASLTSVLHQPFAKLPTACAEMDRKVRQVRLCIEVLRGYLHGKPTSMSQARRLAAAQREYLQDAYQVLLIGIGTSYEEIRLARTAKPEARAALADRLGIDLAGSRTDELDKLFLDIKADPPTLTEHALQRLFGLVDTTVAQPAAEPAADFRAWRLAHLRTIWRSQDRPPDRYDAEPSFAYQERELRPVIDPDVIGPDDLRHAQGGAQPFDLWLKRREWVDGRLGALRSVLPSPPALGPLFAAMYQSVDYDTDQGLVVATPWAATTPPSEFAGLREQLLAGKDVEAVADRLTTDLRLTVEAFTRLMEVHISLEAGEGDLSDAIDILVQACKETFRGVWRDEEQAHDVLLEPLQFWISMTEPDPGAWPPALPAGTPLIDPERDKLTDLPDLPAGESAVKLWQVRGNELATILADLRAQRKAGNYPGMLLLALGSAGQTEEELRTQVFGLQTDLVSADTTVVQAATQEIQSRLRLALEDFTFLAGVLSRTDSNDPAAQPTAEEWTRVETVLTTAQKERKAYPVWVAVEEDAATGLKYWQARKAALPKWRAGGDRRAGWQQALRTRGEPAIVDPDLIGPAELVHSTTGEVYGLWKARRSAIGQWIAEMKAGGDTLEALKTMVTANIGVPLDDLSALDDAHTKGQEIQSRLAQLTLPFPAFRRLIGVADLLAQNALVLADEWEEVHSILAQVRKERLATRWRQEERALDLTIGPDEFRFPPVDPLVFPPPQPPPLAAWRATPAARSAWRETLQSRMDQHQATIDALAELIGVIEEQTLPQLRDALVLATDAPGDTLEQKATWLTKRLLIDARAGGCQRTTRIAQAIETVQGILFAARTGELSDVYPDLELVSDHFDAEWETLGSYATWRAAMLVHLYPELILAPSLRPQATPMFRELVRDTRADTHFTPERACQAARRYSEYLKDIAGLSVRASCRARTRITRGSPCARADSGYSCLLHMYAVAKQSRRVYWSTYDAQAGDPSYAQSFWQQVPGLDDCASVIGAVPYAISEADRHIYLFAITVIKGSRKLVFTRFDLNEGYWQEEPTELELPENATQFQAVVAQVETDDKAPLLAIRVPSGAVYWRRLDSAGSGWADGEWQAIVGSRKGQSFDVLLALIVRTLPERRYLFMRGAKDQKIYFRVVAGTTDGRWHTFGHKGFRGLLDTARNEFPTYAYANGSATFYQEAAIDIGATRKPYETFDEFDAWLRERLGLSLAHLKAPENPFFSAKTLLGLLNSKWTDTILVPFLVSDPDKVNAFVKAVKIAAIEALHNEIVKADSNELGEYGPWKLAAQLVRQVKPELGLRDVLKTLVNKKKVEFNQYDLDSVNGPGGKLPGVGRLAVSSHDGMAPKHSDDGWRHHAHQTTGRGRPKRVRIRYGGIGKGYAADVSWPIAPKLSGPFDIPSSLEPTDVQVRRYLVKQAWLDNTGYFSIRSNLTYLEEAYYFLPVHLAMQLQGQHHLAALDWFRTVYDYAAPIDERKIYPGLLAESYIDTDDAFDRRADWLIDPLNPHAIAATRKDAYTRFTILSIAGIVLDLADTEFTRDTAESVPRARVLYQLALDLLGSPELGQGTPSCQDVIGGLNIEIDDPHWQWAMVPMAQSLSGIGNARTLEATIAQVTQVLDGQETWEARIRKAEQVIASAKTAPPATSLGAVIDRRLELADRIHAAMLSLSNVDSVATRAALSAGRRFVNTVAQVSGIQATKLAAEPVNLPWLRKRAGSKPGSKPGSKSGSNSAVSALDTLVLTPSATKSDASLRWHNPAEPTHASRLALVAEEQPWQAAEAIGLGMGPGYVPTPAPAFCVPANPIPKAMRLRAELNLYKIRTCRNIAGMKRELEPYAAPTDTETGLPFIGGGGQLVVPGTMRLRPTQYRYPVLAERAKQLIGLAQQAESAFLAALEKQEAERYTLLRARHDLGSARAGVQLQRIRSTEAREGVKLAELQRDRAQISVDHFGRLLAEPISSLESLSLRQIRDSMQLSLEASLGAAIPNIIAGMASGSMVDFAGIYANIAQAMRTQAEVLSTLAGYERRAQGWQHEKSLAEQDVKIGEQQIRIAEAHERVVAQETTIAELQQDHAEAVIEFLTTKFTNIELWTFMVPQLERVYAQLLRHATAVAKLAENQLAFERQQLPPARIADDYWTAPDATAFGERGPDRRGLTGSARLQADLISLDQYAFQTNQRKLQLTRTISLAGNAPAEFQLFRQTGVMNFMTTLRDFDREFPGHYMRTIRRVRISFIALIPPTHGVRATLSAAGTSRVVVGGSPFQTTTVFHGPQSVAFSSPRDATGVFEMDPQPDLLLPFEGIGVETGWELRAPKAANVNLDYATIADVLITIEYTALNSFDYRQQVIQSLPTSYSGDRPYSFRHHLADQWFDLHNPDQSATPMTVAFQTRREDFPTNLESIEIKQIAVFVSCAGEPAFEVPIKTLRFTEHGGVTAVGGAATTTNGVASTLKGNAGAWMAILGKQPVGDWELQLPNTAEIRQRFRDEQIEDILLVISFGGRLPPWPA